MDSCLLVPRRPLRPRGLIGLCLAALGSCVLSLPGLVSLAAIWLLVAALGGAIVALPVVAASSLDAMVGMAVGALLGLVSLPFAILWLVAGTGAVLAWLSSRTISAPLGLGEALSLGLRRALPLLGSALVVKVLGSLVLLPAAFLAATLTLLTQAGGPADGAAGQWLRALGLPLVILASAGGAYLCFRLVWAPWSALLEDAGPLEAVGRAWQLSRGQAPRALGLLLSGLLLMALLVGGLAFLALGRESLQAPVLADWLGGLYGGLTGTLGQLGGLVRAAAEAPWPELTSEPRLLAAALLAPALPLAAVCLVYAALSAFFLDLLRRQEGFGSRARLSQGPAPIPSKAEDAADGLAADETAAWEPAEAAAEGSTAAGAGAAAPTTPVERTAAFTAPPSPDWTAAGAMGALVGTAALAGSPPEPESEPEPMVPPEGRTPLAGSAAEGATEASVHPDGRSDEAAVIDAAPAGSPDDAGAAPSVDDALDLGRIEGISLARGPESPTPRRSRLAWLWSWLPEPERPERDED